MVTASFSTLDVITTPCICFKLIGSYHDKGSGKWSSLGYQISLTKVQLLFSPLIPVWISHLLSCSLYDIHECDTLNSPFFLSIIMASQVDLWHIWVMHFLISFNFFFQFKSIFSVFCTIFYGWFFLLPHVCEEHSSFSLSSVSLKILTISKPSSILSLEIFIS